MSILCEMFSVQLVKVVKPYLAMLRNIFICCKRFLLNYSNFSDPKISLNGIFISKRKGRKVLPTVGVTFLMNFTWNVLHLPKVIFLHLFRNNLLPFLGRRTSGSHIFMKSLNIFLNALNPQLQLNSMSSPKWISFLQ